METPEKLLLGGFLVLLGNLFFIIPTDLYGQVVKASAKQLTQESTAILVGQCLKKESFWNENRTKIFTQVRIRADDYVKGDFGSEAVITIPGGRVGNVIYQVSDMPVFVEGEEVLVFLWRHPSGKNLVTGALHGKLSVKEDKKTGKKMVMGIPAEVGEKKALRKSSIKQPPVPTTRFLDEYIKELKSYLKE